MSSEHNVQTAWNDLLQVFNLFRVPLNTSSKTDEFAGSIQVVSQYLSRDTAFSHSHALCVAACQFFSGILEEPSASFTYHQDTLVDCLVSRLHPALSAFDQSLKEERTALPDISCVLGILSKLVDHNPSRSVVDRLIRSLSVYADTFGNLLEFVCFRVIAEQHSLPTDEQEVLVFELLRFWKRALILSVNACTDTLRETTSGLFLSLANSLRRVLVDGPSSQFYAAGDFATAPSLFLLYHPTMAHLLLRSLRSLSKLVLSCGEPLSEVLAILDDTWIRMVCSLDEALVVGEMPSSGLLAFLLSDNVEPGLSVQPNLLDPDPDLCFRLIMLSTLEVGHRSVQNDALISNLLRSMRCLFNKAQRSDSSRITFEDSLVALLLGDDQHLFCGLQLWLKLEERISEVWPQKQSWYNLLPDVHWLFAAFAQSIGYSAHLLIDWIVSPETDCLSYLVLYLRRFRHIGPLCPWASRCTCSSSPAPVNCPRVPVKELFRKTARCLQKLQVEGNIPFSSLPLIRSLDRTVQFLVDLHSS